MSAILQISFFHTVTQRWCWRMKTGTSVLALRLLGNRFPVLLSVTAGPVLPSPAYRQFKIVNFRKFPCSL